ncbi:hypothetical protein ACOSQ4_009740 [Xanthoceras sorbifolium]
MPDKEVAPSRKGKSVASKRPRRTLPKASMGAKIPEEFIKGVSSKRASTTTETSDHVLPEQEVLGGAPSSAMPPIPPRGGKSKAESTESVREGGVIRGRDLVALPLSIDHRWVLVCHRPSLLLGPVYPSPALMLFSLLISRLISYATMLGIS